MRLSVLLGGAATAAVWWLASDVQQELASATPLQGGDDRRVVQIVAEAHAESVYGPWDGAVVGTSSSPVWSSVSLISPPDLAACVLEEGREPQCLTVERDGKQGSACFDSYRCDWIVEVPVGRSFAVVLLDHDDWPNKWGDFVDAFVVAPSNVTAAALEPLDKAARDLIEAMSPTTAAAPRWLPSVVAEATAPNGRITYRPSERARRDRGFTRFTPDACAGESCSLEQSSIRLLTP